MPQNGINHAGVMALASAMRHNHELRVLNFNDNTFTKKGTLAMAQVKPVNVFPRREHSCVFVSPVFMHSLLSAGSETPEESTGGQLWRLPGSLRRSHRPRSSGQGRTSCPQGQFTMKNEFLYGGLCFLCQRAEHGALVSLLRSSICHMARSQKQQLLWWPVPSWTNHRWRE